jgi:hypothetical protein
MTCPPFIFAGAAGIFFGWSSGRLHERTWHITTGLGIAVAGFVLAASTLNVPARYVACFIFAMGAYSVNSVIIGWLVHFLLSPVYASRLTCFKGIIYSGTDQGEEGSEFPPLQEFPDSH